MNSQTTIPWDRLRDVDAVEVARRLGLEPNSTRARQYACIACTSSDAFHVWPDTASKTGRGAYCFSCHRSFSSIDMAMEVLEIDVKAAASQVGEWFGIPMETDYVACTTPRIVHRQTPDESGREVLAQIYAELTLTEQGRAYLTSRGIDPDVSEAMGVRSVDTWEQWRELCFVHTPSELHEAGLMSDPDEANPYLHPGSRRFPMLVLPYTDRHKGYALDTFRLRPFGDADQTPKYLSLMGARGKPCGPFLGSVIEIARDGDLSICEGELNALALLSHGKLAISGCGSGSWEGSWCFGLKPVARVNIVCDGDHPDPSKRDRDAGRRFGVSVASAMLERYGDSWFVERVRSVVCPEGEDANDLTQLGLVEVLGWGDVEEVDMRLGEDWREDYEERFAIVLEGGDVDESEARMIASRSVLGEKQTREEHWATSLLSVLTPLTPDVCRHTTLDTLTARLLASLQNHDVPIGVLAGIEGSILTLWSLVHEECPDLPAHIQRQGARERLVWYLTTRGGRDEELRRREAPVARVGVSRSG